MEITKNIKKAKLFGNCLPLMSKIIGVVKRDRSEGALVLLTNGIYVQMNNGCMRTLNQHDVKAILEKK